MVLMLAVLLWSVSTVITPILAQSIPLLIICRVLLGLGEGLGKILINRYINSFIKYSVLFIAVYCC